MFRLEFENLRRHTLPYMYRRPASGFQEADLRSGRKFGHFFDSYGSKSSSFKQNFPDSIVLSALRDLRAHCSVARCSLCSLFWTDPECILHLAPYITFNLKTNTRPLLTKWRWMTRNVSDTNNKKWTFNFKGAFLLKFFSTMRSISWERVA